MKLFNFKSLQFGPALVIGMGVIFLFWYLQFHWKRRQMYRLSSKVQGPFNWPLVGVALELIGSNIDIFVKIEEWFNKFPRIFKAWLGPILVYGVSDPEYMETILTRCLKKGWVYEKFETVLGHSLATAPTDKWKKHRKAVLPSFNQKILDGFVETFRKHTDELIAQMEKFDRKGEFDLFWLISNYSVDSVCENIMGLEVKAQSSEFLFAQWMHSITTIMFKRICSLWHYPDVTFKMSSQAKIMQECIGKVHEFTDQVCCKKKQAYEASKQQTLLSGDEYYELETKKKVLLDCLIEMESKGNGSYAAKDIRDEMTGMVIASSDSTASTVGFVLTMLGLHPEMQEKLYQEIMEVLGPNRDVEYSDLPFLKYMELIIKETLRLFPAVPLIARKIEEDVDLGDCIIPKGANVVFNFIKLHRDEKNWPNPYKFIPERFLPDEIVKRHPCTYIPFSYGPRSCIGYRYFFMSIKTLLTKIVRKYNISTSYKSVQEIKVKCNLALRAEDGFKVTIKSR